MLPENQLEFISKINAEFIEHMTRIRKKFIELDNLLREFDELGTMSSPSMRTLALSRTHLEIGLQFAIKTLCIMGEEKQVRFNE